MAEERLEVTDMMDMLSFKMFQTSLIFIFLCAMFNFPLSETKGNKNQTGLKTFNQRNFESQHNYNLKNRTTLFNHDHQARYIITYPRIKHHLRFTVANKLT